MQLTCVYPVRNRRVLLSTLLIILTPQVASTVDEEVSTPCSQRDFRWIEAEAGNDVTIPFILQKKLESNQNIMCMTENNELVSGCGVRESKTTCYDQDHKFPSHTIITDGNTRFTLLVTNIQANDSGGYSCSIYHDTKCNCTILSITVAIVERFEWDITSKYPTICLNVSTTDTTADVCDEKNCGFFSFHANIYFISVSVVALVCIMVTCAFAKRSGICQPKKSLPILESNLQSESFRMKPCDLAGVVVEAKAEDIQGSQGVHPRAIIALNSSSNADSNSAQECTHVELDLEQVASTSAVVGFNYCNSSTERCELGGGSYPGERGHHGYMNMTLPCHQRSRSPYVNKPLPPPLPSQVPRIAGSSTQ